MGAALVIAKGKTDRSRPRWRTPLIVTASLAIHAAILGPMALNSLGLDLGPRIIEDPDIGFKIDVVLVRPSLPGEPSRGREIRPADRPSLTTPVAETGRSQDDARFRAGPVAIAPAQAAPSASPTAPDAPRPVPGSTADLSDAWRDGASRLAAGPGRIGPDCRRPETLTPLEREACAQRFAVADAQAASARVGQRRLTRTEAGREEGFAEQAAANEAWARYRRSEDEGSYPGLRSMLKHF